MLSRQSCTAIQASSRTKFRKFAAAPLSGDEWADAPSLLHFLNLFALPSSRKLYLANVQWGHSTAVATMSCQHQAGGLYRPRQPKQSAFYQLVEKFYPQFKAAYEERYQECYGFPGPP